MKILRISNGGRLLLTAWLLTVMVPVFAQSGIVIKVRNTPLKAVLEMISHQSQYRFVYTQELQVEHYKIDLDSDNESIKTLLEKIFKPLNIQYEVKEKQVILGVAVKNQTGSKQTTGSLIRGSVTDDEGGVLPGVFIRAGSGSHAVSNLDGSFEIMARPGESLLFSFMGMQDYSVQADPARRYNIVMQPSNLLLEDVVVTGYQTISKERATGAFDIIKIEQLERPASNIAQRLIGTTAGMQGKTDANGDVSFEIRGQTSLTANAQPLLVVDGFPIQDDFNSINPYDVESITILKDAAAASIWGARSANGVIVITTKKGARIKKGEVKVEVQTFWKYAPKIDWSYANPVASSAEVIEYERKGFGNGKGFFGSAYWLPNEDFFNEYASHSLAVTLLNENRLGRLSDAEMEAQLSKLAGQNNAGQIKKYMLGNPFTQHYNVNIASSTERAHNVLSLMFEQQNKALAGNSQEKYNVGYRTSVKLFKWLEFNFNGNFTMTGSKDNAIALSDLQEISPYEMLVNEDGSRNNERYYNGMYRPNIDRYWPLQHLPYADLSYNPITERESRSFRTNKKNVRAQAGFTFHLLEGLTFDTKMQYETIDAYTKKILNEHSAVVRYTIDYASSWDQKTGKVTQNLPSGGFLDQEKKRLMPIIGVIS